MKVILQKNVQALGKAGDVVETKPGYFRNYLQPRGIAVLASTGAMKKREEDLEQLRKKAETQHQAAVELGEKITAQGRVTVPAKAGEGGRLYGKITTKEIAATLSQQLGQEIDKRSLKVEDISALGTYRATLRLAEGVTAEFNVDVYQEGTTPPEPKKVVKEEKAEEVEQTEEQPEEAAV
jgi:large subunit ribosomal protein L9